MDAQGNLYITDERNKRVRKVDRDGIITTVAGGGRLLNVDGVPAIQAQLYEPRDIAVDDAGNLYIVDYNTVKRVDGNGMIARIVGTGKLGFAGDGGPAVDAITNFPASVACDSQGNVYIADNNRVRMISTTGIINTIAGNGDLESTGDGGPALSASFAPQSIDVDSKGNIYIVDAYGTSIRKVSPGGIITTLVDFNLTTPVPYKIAVDNHDNVYYVDMHQNKIKLVNQNGEISEVAGNGSHIHAGDGGAPLQASFKPVDVAVSPVGDVYIVDYNVNRIRKVSRSFVFSSDQGILVPDQGGIGYLMSPGGRHLETIDLDTQKTLLTFSYDGHGRLIAVTDRFGNRTSILRDSQGRPYSILSPDGMETSLTIDLFNHLREVTYPDGSHDDFDYTTGGLMTGKYTPNGNHVACLYTDDGKLSEVVDPEEGRWLYDREIDLLGYVISTATTPEGNTTRYRDRTYSNGDYTSSITGPTGETTEYTRSADGLFIGKALPCGATLSFTSAIDHQHRIPYILESSERAPSGLTRTVATNRAYTDTNDDGVKDLVTTTTSINTKTVVTTDDTIQGMETTTSPEGRAVATFYDPDTLLTQSVSVPGLFDTAYGYDARGRLITIATDARSTSFAYNPQGQLASITDPQAHTTSYAYDAMGRITRIDRPDGSSVGFSYDLNGNMTLLTTPSSIDHGFGYNGVDLNTAYQTPLSGAYNYTYDKDRRLIQTIFPSGKEIRNIYDKTRLVQIQTPEGEIDCTYSCGSTVASITKGIESISYDYDGKLLTQETLSGTLNRTLSYTYNNDFDIAGFTYAGNTINYTYDNDGLLTGAGGFTITRNAQNGLPDSVSGGGLSHTRTFNGYGEVEGQAMSVNASPIASWSLVRDNSGRITEKAETAAGITSNYQYTYDPMGRLLTVTKEGALVEEYQYGPNGTRTFEMNALRGISGREFTYSDEDHLLMAKDLFTEAVTSYQYDADGFLTEKSITEKTQGDDVAIVTTYDYSSRGELQRVDLPDGRVIEYLNDPLGRRIAKKVNGAITEKYLWQGLTRLLAVYDGSDNLIMRSEYADARMPVAMTKGASTYYLTYDQVGSLRIVADASGNVIKRIDYDSFGNIINDTNPAFEIPLGFAGGLHDRDTGLVRFGYRDYDPETGRWTAKDSILFKTGYISIYEYVYNDPINLVDAWGLYPNNANEVPFILHVLTNPAIIVAMDLKKGQLFLVYSDIINDTYKLKQISGPLRKEPLYIPKDLSLFPEDLLFYQEDKYDSMCNI
ncbi:MAG: RHS repeat-associated core domain-containing protein [bacterium]